MDIEGLRNRLESYLTHGIEGGSLDKKRLEALAIKARVSPQTIRNYIQGKSRKPQAVKIKSLDFALRSEERNYRRRSRTK